VQLVSKQGTILYKLHCPYGNSQAHPGSASMLTMQDLHTIEPLHAMHKLPKTFVVGNETKSTSEESKSFMRNNGILN